MPCSERSTALAGAVRPVLPVRGPYGSEPHATEARRAGATEQGLAETTPAAAVLLAGGAAAHGTRAPDGRPATAEGPMTKNPLATPDRVHHFLTTRVIERGHAPDVETLARLAGCPAAEAALALTRLYERTA